MSDGYWQEIGMLHAESINDMISESFSRRIDKMIFESPMLRPIHHTIHTPPHAPSGGQRYFTLEAPMNTEDYRFYTNPYGLSYRTFDEIFNTWFPPKPAKTAEQIRIEKRESAFGLCDVINGDVIKLTYRLPAGGEATLEGPVAQVRNVGTDRAPEFQVRIEGFGETPHGNHNTWFAIRHYELVRVISRAYRLTKRDRVIAEVAGYSLDNWKKMSEAARASSRRAFGDRADRLISAIETEV